MMTEPLVAEREPAAFVPRILAFSCTWCSYQAADLAGTSRREYSPHVRIVRVPCSGRVDSSFVLKALANGADGVLITGCHPGDCHYVRGNIFAEKRFERLAKLVLALGLEPERVRLEWISAAEGDRLAKTANEFAETIRRLGPLK